MKKYTKFIMLLFLFGCTEKMDIEDIDFDEKIVVNAFLTPDSMVTVYIAKTQGISNTNNVEYINGLTVEVKQEEPVILVNKGNGLYQGNFFPEQDKQYQLTLNNNFINIIGYETVPNITAIKDCYFVFPAGHERYENSAGSIIEGDIAEGYLSFKDDYKAKNYYELALYQKVYKLEENEQTGETDTAGYSFESVSIIRSDDYIFQAEDLNDYKPKALLFSDVLFSGNEISVSFRFAPFLLYNSDFYCVLRSVSENYYLYKKSLIKHLYNKGMTGTDDFQELTKFTIGAEPVELYSNIENGYGIFAAYSSSVKFMEFKNRRTE